MESINPRGGGGGYEKGREKGKTCNRKKKKRERVRKWELTVK
jgi:hypothetical protein